MKLVTPSELSEMVGLAIQTIYNRHSKGGDLPPAIKLGKALRWDVEDVRAWVAGQRQQRPTCPAPIAPAKRRPGRPTKREEIARRQAKITSQP